MGTDSKLSFPLPAMQPIRLPAPAALAPHRREQPTYRSPFQRFVPWCLAASRVADPHHLGSRATPLDRSSLYSWDSLRLIVLYLTRHKVRHFQAGWRKPPGSCKEGLRPRTGGLTPPRSDVSSLTARSINRTGNAPQVDGTSLLPPPHSAWPSSFSSSFVSSGPRAFIETTFPSLSTKMAAGMAEMP